MMMMLMVVVVVVVVVAVVGTFALVFMFFPSSEFLSGDEDVTQSKQFSAGASRLHLRPRRRVIRGRVCVCVSVCVMSSDIGVK